MRLLITGSSGQIGTNLALRCLEDGHAVLGVDRRPNPWTARVETVAADLAVPQAAELATLERPDLVVHLAAHAKVHELVRRPELALENMVATQRVLELCREWNVPIVFSSSREVYGDIHRFDTEETSADFAYTESTYSASKIAGEAMVYAYARCYGLPYIVFRFSNVYGRYDNDLERMERVIPLFIDRIGRGLPITIYGEGKILDFTHVDDCVDGIARGIERLAAGRVANQTINLAHGTGHSLVEMAGFVGAALGRTPRITLAPTQVGEVTRYVANLGKARSLLGYTPRIPLGDGVPLAVAWGRGWATGKHGGAETC
ncbi:NAD-dependent epimerase/dehydratase family protein [Azospirillum agricola]|uniref:NAD-dependent epimerase/dehydratase family protein n=1 Tax=Azospirillum agricola TaxID=1720247 RepID=UPI000A0F1B18|nr:NAD(P)-dependent oxidoreductase [Azospirillum agricola]SMH41870.1 NAD dependent epimerase/dehydratase family protein [Azospirillum lipoferum]